jgi:hypothetical protein
MERIFRHHSFPGGTSPEAATCLPTTRHAIPGPTLHQDGLAGSRDLYYTYNLGREVTQYHQRLSAQQRLDFGRN